MTDELLTDLRAFLGDDLHAFTAYDGDEIGNYYIHEDLEGLLSEEDIADIQQNTILESIGSPGLESVYPEAGTLRATIHEFGEMIVINVLVADTEGVLLSVDADTDVRVRDIVDRCRTHFTE
ncbi:hypothetical protein [Halosegnis longus]|uniref:hypothetical protein n=1 Tax=Halosegnis longus TaxID=2216012 RepID=UPI00129E9BEE|nr:hypothetical protein [Halosegnis longus]